MLNIDMTKPNAHQRLAKAQGDWYHRECVRSLEIAGFEIAAQHFVIKDVGIELDAITNNSHGIAMPWEFKGSWNGERPGLIRTDTLKKAIASGYLLSRWSERKMMTPLLVMSTHMPEAGSGAAMMASVGRDVVLSFVDNRNTKFLMWLYRATEDELLEYMNESE